MQQIAPDRSNQSYSPANPPAFNLPGVILVLAVMLVSVHAIRTMILTPTSDLWVLNVFAFVPIFYHANPEQLVEPLSIYWSPLTYGFLHGSWVHLLNNLLWLTAFGSAVARRFGNLRFLGFMALATVASASAHYVLHSMDNSPVIGASGAISACMGAAIRFSFTSGKVHGTTGDQPALSLVQSLSNRSVMTFLVIWFATNLLFGAGVVPLGMGDQIAWEAHIGGFLFGWLLFSLFDPIKQKGND